MDFLLLLGRFPSKSFPILVCDTRGRKRVGSSYLLTGVAATGNDGHTANFHDCRNIFVSMESVKDVVEIEYVHFIVKVPVAARFGGWFVEVRNSRDRSVRFFAWAGRGFRASVICVLVHDWVTYRLAATSPFWEYFSIGTGCWGLGAKDNPAVAHPLLGLTAPQTAK